MNIFQLREFISEAFKEDFGFGDITSETIFDEGERAVGTFTAKADGILAGVMVIDTGYKLLDSSSFTTLFKKDGDEIKAGQEIAEVTGPVATLLTGERVILNILQHLSGIATATREAVKNLDDRGIKITDTRKTIPGMRMLQKYAVTCGGGHNHRFRLDDAVMIKDNHIRAAGSISKAVKKIRSRLGHTVKIEAETESKEQVLEAVEAGVDIIMLDNCSPEKVKELCTLIPDHILVEISGGVTPANIAGYKHSGADVISLGSLTHSVNALDISFNLNNELS